MFARTSSSRDARVQGLQRHLTRRLVERVGREVGHDARRAAAVPAARGVVRRVAAVCPGDVRKSSRSTNERCACRMITRIWLRVDRDLARAARARQPHLRVLVVADHGRVEVPEPVDLRAAEERHVDQARLQVEGEQLEHARDGGRARWRAWGRRSTGEAARAARRRPRTRRRAAARAPPSAGRGCTRCSAAPRRRSSSRRPPSRRALAAIISSDFE